MQCHVVTSYKKTAGLALDNPHSVVFTGSLLVALKRAMQFVGDEMRMLTWRWTELLQMPEVTTADRHKAVKQSVKFAC